MEMAFCGGIFFEIFFWNFYLMVLEVDDEKK